MRWIGFALTVLLCGCATDDRSPQNLGEFAPRTSGAGNTLVSQATPIAEDFSPLRRLAPAALPDSASAAVIADVESNENGDPLLGEARLLLAAGGKSLYALATSDGSLCAVLTPPDISVCNGLYHGAPRVYSFYHYSGWPEGADNFVVFGLVPDRVREVDVLIDCRPDPALTTNGGFLYEGPSERSDAFDGFVFKLRSGKSTRWMDGVRASRC